MLDIRQLIYDKNNELMVYNKFDSVIENYENEFLNIYGEYYANEVIIENMVYDAKSSYDLEIIEESIKDSFIEFKDNAIKKLKELLKKFTDWIKRIKDSIKLTLFGDKSGKFKLTKKQSMSKAEFAELLKNKYNEKKDTMKITMVEYDIPHLLSTKLIEKIEIKVRSIRENYDRLYFMGRDVREELYARVFNDEISYKDPDRKTKIKKYLKSMFRSDEESEVCLKDIDLDTLLNYDELCKDVIDDLNFFSKETEKMVKQISLDIKNTENDDDGLERVKNLTQLCNCALALNANITSIMINELKTTIRELDKIVNKIVE